LKHNKPGEGKEWMASRSLLTRIEYNNPQFTARNSTSAATNKQKTGRHL
jgi:hypothetical protein